jgi:Cu(I)/Ag(I) efflux system membrane protein CusA/SilA
LSFGVRERAVSTGGFVIDRLTRFSLNHRPWIIAIYAALAAWGWWAMRTTPVDAIPDLSDNQVIVFTDWIGHSAQEVEDQVTYPLTTSLQGLPSVRAVRAQSAFGFSMIYVVFDDAADLYFSRARVLERLSLSATRLPAGVVPTLGPDATGVGHVFWYTLDSDRHSLTELRSIQDWFVRYQLGSVPGVAEVASVGGYVKQYQIDVNPFRLRDLNLPLSDVVRAVQESNLNVGGNVLEVNGTWSIVRGVGLIERVEDLRAVAVRTSNGVPVLLGQVANIKVGEAFRVASLVKGSSEAVGGVIVARAGSNTRDVIAAVKARIALISPGLPDGVRLVPFYDRSQLIDRSSDTLRVALIEEMLLVTLAHVLFLMHARSILVVTLPLPLAVLMSFLGMRYLGVTSNIMSLAGIAIAIGVLVDAGIVVTENAFRHLEHDGVDRRDRRAVIESVMASTRLVGRPVFFSMAIILIAFLPVFALTGQEGKLFHPLAFTKTLAVLAATVMAVTLVPVLCTFLLRGRLHAEDRNPLMRGLQALYKPTLTFALRHRAATLLTAATLFGVAVVLATRLGSEFMPALNEGDLMFMPIADPSVSLEQNTRIAEQQNAALLKFPEVDTVVAKVARADTSTDPAPLNMTETIVHLKPKEQWRSGMTLDRLRAEMSAAVQLPGVSNIWTMPIINRIDMLTTGIRSELGVKIFGADLSTLEQLARQVAEALRHVPGASNVYPEVLTSGQYLNIKIDRQAINRYGLTVANVQDVIAYAIGETPIGTTIEGRERYTMRVRYAPEFRASQSAIGDTLVSGPNGQQVPLRSVASIEPTRGPAMISSENGLLVATVLLNVQGRDVGSLVNEARRTVASSVTLPPGYFLSWSGRFENQEHARQRLRVVIPIAILAIFGLLWWTYRSALDAAHVLLAVPFALTGGVYLVWFLGYNVSVAVWVGFIALFGTAVQTGVVMVIYLDDAVARAKLAGGGSLTRLGLQAAVIEGALLRLRPKVMTVSTVVAGLLPIMWSTRVGAEVMKPIAAPVLGGMVSSLLHVLIVTPVIYLWIHERRLRFSPADPPAAAVRSKWRTSIVAVLGLAAVVIALTSGWLWQRHHQQTPASTMVIQTIEADGVRVSLLSADGLLRQGRNAFVIEFRRVDTNALVSVGEVRASAAMSMPGMTMSGGLQATATNQPGRYTVTGEFGMAGSWQFSLEWNGPSGAGKVAFEGAVQ